MMKTKPKTEMPLYHDSFWKWFSRLPGGAIPHKWCDAYTGKIPSNDPKRIAARAAILTDLENLRLTFDHVAGCERRERDYQAEVAAARAEGERAERLLAMKKTDWASWVSVKHLCADWPSLGFYILSLPSQRAYSLLPQKGHALIVLPLADSDAFGKRWKLGREYPALKNKTHTAILMAVTGTGTCSFGGKVSVWTGELPSDLTTNPPPGFAIEGASWIRTPAESDTGDIPASPQELGEVLRESAGLKDKLLDRVLGLANE